MHSRLHTCHIGFAIVASAALASCAPEKAPSTDTAVAATPAVALTDAAMAAQAAPGSQEQVLAGRTLVIKHGCGDCHGGGQNPANVGWLDGARDSLTQVYKVGPFTTRARNITPDNTTGLGRFSERQIFNALRYGLRPGDTPDVDITSETPGQGNFPMNPKYLAPPMPWPAWRQMTDPELLAIAAYLKRGVKPSAHKVADSEGPPDFWASLYTPQYLGPRPAAPFPQAQEVGGVAQTSGK